MKVITQILVFVFCFFYLNYKAQIYFNNRYDTFGSCDGTNGIDTMYGGYISASMTCSALSYNTFVLNLYNLNGSINKKKIFLRPNNFVPSRRKYIKANNGNILISGYRAYQQDTSLAFLWKFNSNLDSIKYTEFGFLNKANVVNSFINHSSYLYYTGYVDSLNTNSNVLLIKTDTAGNEIWKKKIGIVGWDENAFSIDTINGKLLLSGLKVMHNTSVTYGFVMLLDTAANIIWQKTVTTNNGYQPSYVKTLKDGNILIYNGIRQYTIGSLNYNRLHCEKIDINNNTIWQQEYNVPSIGAEPLSAIENHRGNIVIAGQIGTPPNIINGIVNEIKQNGDSLFTRQYANDFSCQNYFRDVVQAPDRGYCFAGFFIPIFANGCTGSQDVWLLKVDSNFCESAMSCGYPTGNNEQSFLNEVVRVYPSPASNLLTFKFESNSSENIKIKLFDIFGKLVIEYQLHIDSNNEFKTDVSDFLNGIYYLEGITESNNLIHKKIIIQN